MNTQVSAHVFISEDGFPLANVSVRLEVLVARIPSPISSMITNASGMANFTIPSITPPFLLSGQTVSLRASLVDASNQIVRSVTRSARIGATTRIALGLSAKDYLASGLAPHSPDQTQIRMASICRTMTNEAKTPLGRINLCLMHAILGSATRLEAPTNEIEKQVSKLVTARFGPEATKQARLSAEEMLKNVRGCNLPPEVDCTDGIDLNDMAKHLFGGGSPIYPGIIDLAQRQEPDPSTTLGPQGRGWPFTTDFVPSKDCAQQYSTDFPNGNNVLAPPTVNLIEAWDPGVQSILREGHVAARRLVARALDVVHGWHLKTTEMNVPVTASSALLLLSDMDTLDLTVPNVAHLPNGNQVLAIDVRPGLKIRLSGANFIEDTCTMSARFNAWGAPVDRKLAPQATSQIAAGLDGLQLSVHGDNTQPPAGFDATNASRDQIVFEWPANLSTPGLYSIVLSFVNNTGIPTTMTHDANCATAPDFLPARSQVLHFVILPDLVSAAATVRLTEAECIAKNSLIYDNVFTSFNGATVRFSSDASSGGIEAEILDEAGGEHSRLVFTVPVEWEPGLQAFPNTPPRPLRFDEITTAQLIAIDVPHPVANIIVAIMIFVMFLIGLLLIISLLAALIALIIAGGLIVATTGGVAAPAVATVVAALIAGMFGIAGGLITLLGGSLGGLFALVVASFNAEPIGTVDVSYGGAELAHLTSDFRFHQAIWVVPRNRHFRTGGGMDHDGESISAGGVREFWASQAGGGDYRFTIHARPS